MTIESLVEQLGLEAIVPVSEDRPVSGCYIGDLLSWVLGQGKQGQLWLTVMGHINVIAVAKLVDFSGVVLCEGAPLDEDAREQAEKNQIPVYTTQLPLYELAVEVSKLLPTVQA